METGGKTLLMKTGNRYIIVQIRGRRLKIKQVGKSIRGAMDPIGL